MTHDQMTEYLYTATPGVAGGTTAWNMHEKHAANLTMLRSSVYNGFLIIAAAYPKPGGLAVLNMYWTWDGVPSGTTSGSIGTRARVEGELCEELIRKGLEAITLEIERDVRVLTAAELELPRLAAMASGLPTAGGRKHYLDLIRTILCSVEASEGTQTTRWYALPGLGGAI
jgi:hypothetical protein